MDPSLQVPNIAANVKHKSESSLIKITSGSNFYGTHDENSHATDHSKKLKYNQIDAIYDSVIIAPKQSATQLRRNLMQAKGSPEQHKHMDSAQLRLIQRRVQTARQELTKQKLYTSTVPKSLGELTIIIIILVY
jgi:hypothetical protein